MILTTRWSGRRAGILHCAVRRTMHTDSEHAHDDTCQGGGGVYTCCARAQRVQRTWEAVGLSSSDGGAGVGRLSCGRSRSTLWSA
jgi:hypothetical protein